MQTRKSSRVLAVAVPMRLPAVDVIPVARRAGVCIFCLAALIFLTATRVQVTRLKYEITKLHDIRLGLVKTVRELRIEEQHLSSPKRIAPVARQMGLILPGEKHTIILDE